MTVSAQACKDAFNNAARFNALLEVVRNRMTNRAFAPPDVPREHFEMILEAARHAPSGANAQPWHYIVVTNPVVKEKIGECFVEEQQHRAKLKMKFPTPNYNGVKTAPGLIVIVADFRFIKAFPVLIGPPLKPSYKRWKKSLKQIMSWDRFNPRNFMTDAQIDLWVKNTRHKVIYRDESKID